MNRSSADGNEIFAKIFCNAFDCRSRAALVVNENVAEHFTLDAEAHYRSEIVTVGKRGKNVLIDSKRNDRHVAALGKKIFVGIIGEEDNYPSLGILKTSVKLMLNMKFLKILNSLALLINVEKVRVGNIVVIFAFSHLIIQHGVEKLVLGHLVPPVYYFIIFYIGERNKSRVKSPL